MITTMLFIALASAAATADDKIDEAAKRYTPEIRGVLLDGTKPVASNVCLRPINSQIRQCGYTDFSGNFYIPPSGPMHSVVPKADDKGVEGYPSYVLEIGRVTEARKIGAIDLTNDKRASIVLECNLARSGGNADAMSICDRKSAQSTGPSRVSQAESKRSHAPAHPAK
jgi:hypothetical protein